MPLPAKTPPPNPDPAVGRPGVDGTVAGDGDGVDCVVVGGVDGLDTAEVGGPPDLEAPVPGDRIDDTVRDGEGGDGVGVLDPEPFPVAADADVVGWEDEAAEAVVDGGKRREEAVMVVPPFGVRQLPHADLAVLVSRKDLAIREGDGLDGAIAVTVKGRYHGEGFEVPDGDLVGEGNVEEVVGEGEGADVAGVVGSDGGEAEVVEKRRRGRGRRGGLFGRGGFLEGRERREGLEGEV